MVGVVDWRNEQFARVLPLYNESADGWIRADSADYPDRGTVFWWNPYDTEQDTPILFTVAENNSGKGDRYNVQGAQFIRRALDFRHLPYPVALDHVNILKFSVTPEVRTWRSVYVHCRDDVLIGPFDVAFDGDVYYVPAEGIRKERIPFSDTEAALVQIGDHFYCARETPFTDYLDCRSDDEILRTALNRAVETAGKSSESVPSELGTKALRAKATTILLEGVDSAERAIDRMRIERAIAICEDSAAVAERAAELTSILLAHPRLVEEFDAQRRLTREEAVAEAKAILATELSVERAELHVLRTEIASLRTEHMTLTAEVARARHQFDDVDATVARELEALEATVTTRIADLVTDASDLLSESVLLRAIGVGPNAHKSTAIATRAGTPFPPSDGFVTTADPKIAARTLRDAGAQTGIDVAVLLRIHAALEAGLLPIVTGNGATAALATYSAAARVNRVTTLAVTHDFLHPVDLLGVRSADPSTVRLHADQLLAADADAGKNGPGLVVLEAFNRAPAESYLVPWLQTPRRAIEVPRLAQATVGSEIFLPHDGLFLAATAASGATTAPVGPDIWSHCVAIDVPAAPGPGFALPEPEVILARRTIASTPPPVYTATDRVRRAVGDRWPIDDGVLGAARRFGTALSLFESPDSLDSAIVECVVVPALASSISGPTLDDAIEALIDRQAPDPGTRTATLLRLARRHQHRFA